MTNLPEGNVPRDLRASDHDRDRVAEVLRQAAGEGPCQRRAHQVMSQGRSGGTRGITEVLDAEYAA